ncbi:unnamed protein product [Heligmosomoides polygyrus]|uniref:F-box domain-containing protein n=1 Tax=Heligmosomoides polygyrus TaxID=6339 RepID=A0A183FWQ3_HELPZ|nr:unnamed protein product [Heligmosomoides polygyrus]
MAHISEYHYYTMTSLEEFPFFNLPYDLQLEVLKKMPVDVILTARLACSRMNELIERHRLSLPPRMFPEVELHPLADDDRHLVYDEDRFAKLFKNGEIAGLTISYIDIDDEVLTSLKNAVKGNRIRVQRLGVDYCRISTNAQSFAEMVDLMGCFELSIVHCAAVNESFSSELARLPVIKKLERFGMLLPADVSDNYLLESRNEWLAIIGTNITTAAIKQFVELPTEIDAQDILADVDCELIDGNWMIRNKYGEQRTVGVCERCIQIFSDDAMLVIEENLN